MSRPIISGESVAGPSVAMILVLRMAWERRWEWPVAEVTANGGAQ